MISCTSATAAWPDYLIAEEKDLVALSDELSHANGAQVAFAAHGNAGFESGGSR